MSYIIYDLASFLVCLIIFVFIYKNTIHLKKTFTVFFIIIITNNFVFFYLFNLKFYQLFNIILLDISYILIYLEVMSILERGYTLNILKSIASYQGEITFDNIHRYYSSKRGLIWLYEKRINSLLNLKLIIIQNNKIKLTSLGKTIAIIFNIFFRVLMIKRRL
jgi:hypothetical protein